MVALNVSACRAAADPAPLGGKYLWPLLNILKISEVNRVAILETAAISGIISQVLSMSTNLTERISDRKDLASLREIQKLVLELQTRYTVLQDENFELKEKLLSLKSKLNIARKAFDDHSQYEQVVSKNGDVYLKHKTVSNLFSCANCFGEKQKIMPLQPCDPFGTGERFMRMCTLCQNTVITVDPF